MRLISYLCQIIVQYEIGFDLHWQCQFEATLDMSLQILGCNINIYDPICCTFLLQVAVTNPQLSGPEYRIYPSALHRGLNIGYTM